MSHNVESVSRLIGDMKETVSMLASSVNYQMNCP